MGQVGTNGSLQLTNPHAVGQNDLYPGDLNGKSTNIPCFDSNDLLGESLGR
jgi:hypothetical protein